jgi:8-oxo-dGTP pyrophosphatase MutT (NUDIX family)
MSETEDHMQEDLPPKEPRPAATIILVRDSESGLQTYLLKRSSRSKFFPSSYVFPGGVLDEDDKDITFWVNHIDISMADVSRRFGGDNLKGKKVIPYCVAAIRETFEEAGALIVQDQPTSYQEVCRIRLPGGLETGWLKDLVSRSDSILNLAALSRWSHWITPKRMKYHFDTLFFVAIMPEGQTCTPDEKETEAGLWISPKEALAANLESAIPLTPPTIVTMHELLDYPDTASLQIEWETRPWGEARLPRMIQTASGPIILEPWDPEYQAGGDDLKLKGEESKIFSSLEPFSRLCLHNGIWKPVRV